ncbi:MAG: hypothetical protein ACI3ZC_00630 [Candidatus Cryptobacteroides sp.]
MRKEISARAAVAAIVAVLAVPACGWLDRDGGFSRTRGETGSLPGERRPDPPPGSQGQDTVVYVTAVSYPEGYEWQKDSSGTDAPCVIQLYANGVKTVEVPAGSGCNASPDADMHRCLGGHLYTDFSTPDETIISCDGKELFRYSGREMICGFIVGADGVYTLGQNRSGNGSSFRRNGKIIFSSSSGQVMGGILNSCSPTGALYEDCGRKVFCYRNSVDPQYGSYSSYHVVRDGTSEQIIMDGNITKVHDIRQLEGVLHIVADLPGSYHSPMLFVGDEVMSMTLPGYGFSLVNCRLIWSGNKVAVRTDVTYDGWKTFNSVLIFSSSDQYRPGEYCRAVDFYMDGEEFACVYTRESKYVTGMAYTSEGSYHGCASPGGPYVMMNGDCGKFVGGVLYAGLSSGTPGGYPAIIRNNKVDYLKINGFITSVRVVLPDS